MVCKRTPMCFQATDKYRGTIEINVQQPAIVLLNPEDAGSLLAEPKTIVEQRTAEYWHERAFVYQMGMMPTKQPIIATSRPVFFSYYHRCR